MVEIGGSFYQKGYAIALANAKHLHEVADKAAELKSFGAACSLNILAAEEAIKAVVILLRHYQPQMDAKEFKEVFTSHKKKHSIIQVATFLSNYFVDSIYNQYLENKQAFDLVETLPEPEKIQLKSKYKLFYEMIEWVKNKKHTANKFEEAFKWWQHANDQKNLGLYVDLRDGKWHDPNRFSEETFKEERKYTVDLIEHIETFNATLLPIKMLRELSKLKEKLTI